LPCVISNCLRFSDSRSNRAVFESLVRSGHLIPGSANHHRLPCQPWPSTPPLSVLLPRLPHWFSRLASPSLLSPFPSSSRLALLSPCPLSPWPCPLSPCPPSSRHAPSCLAFPRSALPSHITCVYFITSVYICGEQPALDSYGEDFDFMGLSVRANHRVPIDVVRSARIVRREGEGVKFLVGGNDG
jgi:hypothetical protein